MSDDWEPFEGEILEWFLRSASGVSRRQLDAALTALLLFVRPTPSVRAFMRKAIASGRCAIDWRLLQAFLRNAPRTIRLRGAGSAAAREATAQAFNRFYRSTVAGSRLTRNQRFLAAYALLGRLNYRPFEAESYATDVLAFLRDPDVDVVLCAIPSVAKLTAVGRDDADRLIQLLGRRSTRLSALSALNTILGHGAYPVSELGPAFWKKIERIAASDDSWERDGARQLMSLRPRPVSTPSSRRTNGSLPGH
jgi:hypothetical protein